MLFLEVLKLCRKILLFLPFTTAQTVVPTESSFSYDNAAEWHLDYPQCGGQRQSPIAINGNKTTAAIMPPITYVAYDQFFSEYVILENNGHTIKFDVPPTIGHDLPFISDGPLSDAYLAVEVHFHWGSPTSKGSEHRLNQRRYDVEMHVVHRNRKYGSVEEAREFEDGLAVIGVFFKAEKIFGVVQPGLETVFNAIPFAALYNSTATTRQLITLGSLLANINRGNFYTYQGSLTTPPCSEAVTWIVYPEVIPIAIRHLQNFWVVRDERLRNLWNNFRPLQPIGSREVYYRNEAVQEFY
ncbi:carbonic anhydrase 2-like [Anastrepha obliqua]|uniref:carbonic anhydrase 2-like n=1 Tax=Anastrepha obliqua TaxID=95512 RepID=UPI00240A36C4|nr:carbonic anhydrase 2-like [Anastrepha obliqua]